MIVSIQMITWLNYFYIFAVCILFLISCGEKKDENPADPGIPESANNQSHSEQIEVKTFEVKDSSGKPKGWGYDLYVAGKRSFHQPIIPAVAGNNSFETEADAKKTGELAANKMKSTGSFPTISISDLDSLGIKHK